MKLILTNNAYLKIKYYIECTNLEISGLGKSTFDGENIIVEDIMIFKQECSPASTVLDDKNQAQFINQVMKKKQKIEDWNVWWHSHADMDVFWSGTDENTIRSHSNQTNLISLVGNKKGKFKARLDLWPKDNSPFNIPVIYTKELLVELETLNNEELKQRIQQEISQKVSQKFQQTWNNNDWNKDWNKNQNKDWNKDWNKNWNKDNNKIVTIKQCKVCKANITEDEINYCKNMCYDCYEMEIKTTPSHSFGFQYGKI